MYTITQGLKMALICDFLMYTDTGLIEMLRTNKYPQYAHWWKLNISKVINLLKEIQILKLAIYL